MDLRDPNNLVFRDTNWNWQKGQSWAIIGPNGSGKSGLARAVSRPIAIEKGEIRYYWKNEDDPKTWKSFPEKGDIAWVSPAVQKQALDRCAGYHQARWQSFEGEDAPRAAGFLVPQDSKINADALKKNPIIKILGISYLLERKLHLLSHGEGRKVIMARALLSKPKLLVLDDPFGGLDPNSRKAFAEIIREILSAGSPHILLVVSREDELPEGISHLLYVDRYRVVLQGPREEVLSKLKSMRVLSVQKPIEGAIRDFSGLKTLYPTYKAGGPVIEMNKINIKYQSAAILKDIDWQVNQGERWLVSGPNGAGKSTLLSLVLADNPQAYANKIKLFGKDYGSGDSIWDIKRRIGWVSPELHEYYSAGHTCVQVVESGFFDSIGLYRRPSFAQQETAVAWMKIAGIEDRKDKPFAALSLSEQRVALLCRALVKGPPLLILDEPCQSLDAERREFVLELLDKLCAQTAVTLLFVTHYQNEIPNCIDHVLRLEGGRKLKVILRAKIEKNYSDR